MSYPVYQLPTGIKLLTEGTRKLTRKEFVDKEGNTIFVERVLDDTSIEGDTIGKRRMVLASQEIPLVKLRTGVYFLGDLIKVAEPKRLFVDSNGYVFRYLKSSSVSLIFRKIVQKLPVPGGMGTVIEVEGIPTRYKTLQLSQLVGRYAGLLARKGGGYILYGTYESLPSDTRRKV